MKINELLYAIPGRGPYTKGFRNPKRTKLVDRDILSRKTPTMSELMKKHNIDDHSLHAQLIKGIKAEREHTDDTAIAREIALDHLDEFPDYYDRLEKMENDK